VAAVVAAALFALPASGYADELDTYAVSGTEGAGVALRSAPGRDQPSLGVLPEGALVQVLERVEVGEPGGWFSVRTSVADLPSGFCSTAFLAPRAIRAAVVGYATGADGGAVGATTASGTQTRWGIVAADWRMFPKGTRLTIEGFPGGVFVVEDTGSGVRGTLIDIWFPDLAAAVAFGTQRRHVTVLS
jgi:3D (Asp-Asp-Asp) domain-containing protein